MQIYYLLSTIKKRFAPNALCKDSKWKTDIFFQIPFFFMVTGLSMLKIYDIKKWKGKWIYSKLMLLIRINNIFLLENHYYLYYLLKIIQ